jgi:hypothetical protein
MTLKRMDNVLIVVDDLEATKAFFIELGLKRRDYDGSAPCPRRTLLSPPPQPSPQRGGSRIECWCRQFINRSHDCIHDRVDVFVQLLIAETNDAEAARGEPIGAPLVVLDGLRIQMLRAIELDDEFVREANKINDVGSATIRNGRCPCLATKLPTTELLSAGCHCWSATAGSKTCPAVLLPAITLLLALETRRVTFQALEVEGSNRRVSVHTNPA